MGVAMGAAPEVTSLPITVASVLNAKDHFQVLGLEPKRCGGLDIKRAYRQTALKVHPDKCSDTGAMEAFRRLQEAFKVLSDPSLHARYAQTLASAQSAASAARAAGRARERTQSYAARARVSKEELERQVKEMMAAQSKRRPMATGQAAQKAAEERVAKERARQQRLEAEERARQAEAARRRTEAEKALNSARTKPKTPRTPRMPKADPHADPEEQRRLDERAKRRQASMSFLGDQFGWERATSRRGEESQGSSRQGSARGSSSARTTAIASPFGELRTMRRAQTERSLRSAKPPPNYLPRFMRDKGATGTVMVKV